MAAGREPLGAAGALPPPPRVLEGPPALGLPAIGTVALPGEEADGAAENTGAASVLLVGIGRVVHPGVVVVVGAAAQVDGGVC